MPSSYINHYQDNQTRITEFQELKADLVTLQNSVNTLPTGGGGNNSGGNFTGTLAIRLLNTADYANDLITLLGTNNSVFTNPHPIKTTNSASSVGSGTVQMFTDRVDNELQSNNVENSWIQVDIANNDTSRRVILTGLGLKSRSSTASSPVGVVIEGSNNASTFTLIHTWSSIGFTAGNQWRGVAFNNNISYRYVRIRQPGASTSSNNFFTLNEVALYGVLNIL